MEATSVASLKIRRKDGTETTVIEEGTKKFGGAFFVYFGADWCGPCKALKPMFKDYPTLFVTVLHSSEIAKDEPLTVQWEQIRGGIPKVFIVDDRRVFAVGRNEIHKAWQKVLDAWEREK